MDAETGVQDQESSGALDEMPSGRGIEGVSTTSPPEPAVPAAAPNTPVSAAVARLDTLSSRPLAEHPDVYQSIHADLQGALADIDDA